MSSDNQEVSVSVSSDSLADQYQQIKTLLQSHEPDYVKFFEKNNNSAGTRLRKMFLDIKKLCHDGRQNVQSEIIKRKKERKDDKPEVDKPKVDKPTAPKKPKKPKVDAPKVDAPEADAPEADAPEVEAPASLTVDVEAGDKKSKKPKKSKKESKTKK